MYYNLHINIILKSFFTALLEYKFIIFYYSQYLSLHTLIATIVKVLETVVLMLTFNSSGMQIKLNWYIIKEFRSSWWKIFIIHFTLNLYILTHSCNFLSIIKLRISFKILFAFKIVSLIKLKLYKEKTIANIFKIRN